MTRISLVAGLLACLVVLRSPSASAARVPPPTPPVPTPISTSTVPTPPPSGVAAVLLAAINKDRAKHRAPALTLDVKQSICSRKHSLHMAAIGHLAHDQFPTDICVPHVWAGENIGAAYGDPAQAALMLHRMMMNEGPCPHRSCPGDEFPAHGHYLNLINPRYTRIGIGVVVKDDTVWLTENFTG